MKSSASAKAACLTFAGLMPVEASEINLAKLLDDGWRLQTVTQSNERWCPFTFKCAEREMESPFYMHLVKEKGLAVCIASAWMSANHPKSECRILKPPS